MEKQITEIIAHHVGGTYEAKQKCAEEILRLFSVVGRSEQLPPNPITDKEHKDLMKALYPKDKSKCFRR